MHSITAVAVLVLIGTCQSYDPEENEDTIGILHHWGYPGERHHVTTQDGYILELHRVPYGKQSPNTGNKPVVFLQHGLECSSSNWVTNLPSESAVNHWRVSAFIFADAGYDVWMGNFRGNTYSRSHTSLSPSSRQFWQFSWDEMASQDLPAMINYVLQTTNQAQLNYVGHSMGTMTAFAEFSMNPALRAKVKNMFALGPVATVGHLRGFIHYLANYLHTIQWLLNIIGENEFLPQNWFVKVIAEIICAALPNQNHLCENILFLIVGPESNQFNNSRIAVYLAHTPAGTSSQNMIHFGQQARSGLYQAYDWGSISQNRAHYGQATPPQYSVANFTIPTYLFWGSEDWLADPTDIQGYLIPNLPNIVQNNFKVDWNHMDFIWGMRAAAEVYQPILTVMNAN